MAKEKDDTILNEHEINILKNLKSSHFEMINTALNATSSRNWIYDVVILEFVEGNKVKAWLNDINEKYLKFTLTCDMCHLTCTKLVADKDEYIKLITSPDEYWDEYIDSFMSKHFKVVEDDEDDV